MVKAVFGLPSSGKSYFLFSQYILPNIHDTNIISNIPLKPGSSLPDNYYYFSTKDYNSVENSLLLLLSSLDESDYSHSEIAKLLFNIYRDKVEELYPNTWNDSYNLSIIYDEAHFFGFRGTQSKISHMDELLSIHRHMVDTPLRCDIILCTQVHSRLNTVIQGNIEETISCVAETARVHPSIFEYMVYSTFNDYSSKNALMSTHRYVRVDPNVFSLYQSGSHQKGSNSYRKRLFLLIAGIFLGAFFIYFMVKNVFHTSFDSVDSVSTTLNSKRSFLGDSNSTPDSLPKYCDKHVLSPLHSVLRSRLSLEKHSIIYLSSSSPSSKVVSIITLGDCSVYSDLNNTRISK